jgi:hypothetical protein
MRGAQKCLLRSVIRPTSPSVDSLDKAALGRGEQTKWRVYRENERKDVPRSTSKVQLDQFGY